MSAPPAAWYEDPSDPLRERFWDGAVWTEMVRPRPPAVGEAVPTGSPSLPPPPVAPTASSSPTAPAAVPGASSGGALRQVFSGSGGAGFGSDVFGGRISRAALGYWILCAVAIRVVLSLVDVAVDGAVSNLVLGVASLGLTAVTLSAWVRRMHDIGRSGWYVLFFLLPLGGFIYLVVLACRRGDPAANQYGPPPAS